MMEKTPATYAIETVDLVKRFTRQSDWKALLRRRRGETVALDSVSIQVRKGEIFGVLGPNGAGKTTLIKVLSTLILPTSGQAFVNGLNTTRQSTEVRKCIGVIYGDERTFFWRLNVVENLRFYAALYRMPRDFAEERIKFLLDMVGLTDATDVRMHHFSSGMKQRAAIARGLLGDPEIVFMDEPTRSLDPLGAFEIRQIIRERLVAGGKHTVLVATNLMAEAEILCDRVALIDQGRLQLMGSVEELRRVISDHERYILELSHIHPDQFQSLLKIPGMIVCAWSLQLKASRTLCLRLFRGLWRREHISGHALLKSSHWMTFSVFRSGEKFGMIVLKRLRIAHDLNCYGFHPKGFSYLGQLSPFILVADSRCDRNGGRRVLCRPVRRGGAD
jgi:ABC-2 type transport system ATP-binding protein